nr:Fic family protein [Pseudomarimonas arenosa]
MLKSALFRPQTGYYEDVVAEAAALMESLAINHPFIDGNQRIAFATEDVFANQGLAATTLVGSNLHGDDADV